MNQLNELPWQQIPDFIKHLLDSITAYSIWAWLLVIGLVLIAFSIVKRSAKGTAFWDLQLRDTPLKWSLVLGICLLGLSQLSVLTHLQTARQISAAESFLRLKSNARVRYVVRIVPYDPQENQDKLSVGKIKNLGSPGTDFVFVGDYEELRNYTVKQAIYKLGGTVSGLQHIKATVIIFPLDNRMLYPANARGLLQVISIIDKKHKSEPAYQPFQFTPDQTEVLNSTQIESYAWKNIRDHFEEYKALSTQFRSNNFGAAEYMGKIENDWQPEGYAQVEGLNSSDLDTPDFELDAANGQHLTVKRYGARVFLIANMQVSDIDDVIICGFSNLDHGLIPDVGGKSDQIIQKINANVSEPTPESVN
jgi:hypothetical protein